MKFQCENELEIFEFHDATTISAPLNHNVFEMNLKYLNVHKKTSVNPGMYDRQIKNASLKFTDCIIESLDPTQGRKPHVIDGLYTEDSIRIYTGESAVTNLTRICADGYTILSFDITETNGRYFVHKSAVGEEPYFEVRFTFKSSYVQWDEYAGKAWYEEDQWKNRSS